MALDLSGHGESGRRDHYDMDTWAREVIAVADHSCLPAPPIVVAHSMGGWVGITLAAEHGDDLAGLILLDSMVARPDPEVEAARVGVAFGPLRTYPTLEEALAHFRTVPDQPTSLPYVIDHVARESLRPVSGGYTWKFDPKIFERRQVPSGDTLQRVRCRVSLFRAEHGLVSRDIGAYMYEQLGRVAPIVEVPLAWHHIMLDQPIPLVTGSARVARGLGTLGTAAQGVAGTRLGTPRLCRSLAASRGPCSPRCSSPVESTRCSTPTRRCPRAAPVTDKIAETVPLPGDTATLVRLNGAVMVAGGMLLASRQAAPPRVGRRWPRR